MALVYSTGSLTGTDGSFTLPSVTTTDAATFYSKTTDIYQLADYYTEDGLYLVQVYSVNGSVVGASVIPLNNTNFTGDIVIEYFIV